MHVARFAHMHENADAAGVPCMAAYVDVRVYYVARQWNLRPSIGVSNQKHPRLRSSKRARKESERIRSTVRLVRLQLPQIDAKFLCVT